MTAFLVGFFEKYVQYDFTAELEADLDKIADGSRGWKSLLSEFLSGFNDNVNKVSNRKIGEVIEYFEKSLVTTYLVIKMVMREFMRKIRNVRHATMKR